MSGPGGGVYRVPVTLGCCCGGNFGTTGAGVGSEAFALRELFMAVFPEEARINELNQVAGDGGQRLWLRLYTNNPKIDAKTTLSDLAEANYPGYTPYNSAMWSAPVIDTNGDAIINSPVVVFRGPDSLPGDDIYGWFVTIDDGTSALLWFVEKLPNKVFLEFPTDQLPLQVQARLRYLSA